MFAAVCCDYFADSEIKSQHAPGGAVLRRAISVERQPGAPHRRGRGSRRGDEHVVADPCAGVGERHDRPDMAATGRRGEEDPHVVETRRARARIPVPVGDDVRMAYDEDLANLIREVIAGEAGVTERRMFGGLAVLVGGNMAVAASGQGGLMVRVDPDETDALAAEPHAGPFEMRGRPMQGWLRVDAEGVRTRSKLQPWVERGVAYARSLPPK